MRLSVFALEVLKLLRISSLWSYYALSLQFFAPILYDREIIMIWKIHDTGISSAEENMRYDASLLERLSSEEGPILHFYDWETLSVTYGYFMEPEEWIDLEEAKKHGISFARRPTGGGIVFHLWDMAFSALVPSHCKEFSLNTLDNYAFINDAVLQAVSSLFGKELEVILEDAPSHSPGCRNFCMARPTKYDVILQGRKIAGAAQRKTKEGFLHQGTISLKFPEEALLRAVLKPGTGVLEAILASTHPLVTLQEDLSEIKQELKKFLAIHLNEASLKLHNL